MKVICVAGYKNSGKTTLVTRLVDALSKKGSTGTVKQMLHHRFNPENTDTGKHFDAGADVVAAITDSELVTIKRNPTLEDSLNALADSGVEFAIVEGAKSSDLPKIFLGDVEGSDDISNIIVQLPVRSEWDIDALVELVLDQPEWVTLDSLIRKVRSNPDIRLSGGIATFTGIVRRINGDVETTAIDFEKYEGVADRAIEKICFDLKQEDNIIDVLIHHRTGLIRSGEDIVYIVVAAAHRQELFETLTEALERIKDDVPIWKKEFTIEGDFWVHDKL
ncbi:molybdopterin synthase [Methanolobus profundi]|uniref:Molybdopterin synthase subunit MoaE /molybdopterin guanine dinucleotide biosynthesis accessory protein MobB n=1 Tax=Methanolobus profundi TaxID=487685 RepID=A0A1I4NR72_9EURY|nr:molybdopterin synthase [Methanolobus profundi]SFM17895.1 molybdopterin synthase subunit MoaE /molybdopterin guanine dinucleotide biosynthesis accessory protein MobB [Methanolobus profundi]